MYLYLYWGSTQLCVAGRAGKRPRINEQLQSGRYPDRSEQGLVGFCKYLLQGGIERGDRRQPLLCVRVIGRW